MVGLASSEARTESCFLMQVRRTWCRIVNEVRTLIEKDLTSGEKVWFVYNRYTLDIKN